MPKDYSMEPFFRSLDVAVLGRKTWDVCLGVVPVLLGEGIPLFPSGFPQRDFKLVENLTFSKGSTSLKYDRVRAKSKAKRS